MSSCAGAPDSRADGGDRLHSTSALALVALLALAGAACACGDKQSRTQNPQPPVGGGHAVANDAGHGSGEPIGVRDAGADAPLTDPECRALVEHVLELAMREFRQKAAEEGLPIPSEAEVQKIRDNLHQELGPQCMRRPRGEYDCAMRAEDRSALEACQAAEAPVNN